MVGAAAADEHREMGDLTAQLAVQPPELDRIAIVEIHRRVELGMAGALVEGGLILNRALRDASILPR